MAKPYNILFSAAGRRVSLLRHFRRTLDDLGLRGEILAADAGRSAPATFVADRQLRVPRVKDPDYIDAMVALCRDNGVRLLFPLIDTDLELLASNRDAFAEVGTTVVVSDARTAEICFDKKLTWRFFRDHGIDTPEVLDASALDAQPDTIFPLLIKPYDGSCGIGVTKIRDRRELVFFSQYVEHAMVQEFVQGTEYTIDVLVGFDGRIGCIVPRRRLEIRAGEVSKGLTVRSPAIMAAARRVVEALPGPLGCITVQCFEQPDGRIRFIEINPRFGGGFPLSLHAGADFPRWLIEQDLSGDPTTYRDDWTDDLAMLRYDDEIIVRGERIR
jgi:carbamoyl-phosphate synthase large subunit